MKRSKFKKELSLYKTYKDELKIVKGKIEAVETEMRGVKSPSLIGSRGSSNPQKKTDNFYKLSAKLEELENERDRLEKNINYIHKKLLKIKDKTIRQAAIELYAYDIGIRELCKKYNYSRSGLSKKISIEIKKIEI